MIRPELLTFCDLLTKRLYLIPDYQRSYSWESKQRKALFADIDFLYEKHKSDPTSEHFMSTIVCLERESETIDTDVFNRYDIVDGQQRLTTLIILLKCIELKLDKKSSDYSKLAEILVKKDKETTPILLMNHDDNQVFSNFIKKGKITKLDTNAQKSDLLIIEAIQECTQFVKDWMVTKTIESLYALLKNNLYFVLHVIENEGRVYKIFEVLNSRGLPVEWLDRLKSVMMGILFEKKATTAQIDSIHKTWGSIYKDMGCNREYGATAIRFLAALKNDYSRIKSEEDCVSELIAECNNDVSRTINIAEEISTIIKDIKRIETKYFQYVLMKVQHARFLALCIEKSNFSQHEKDILFSKWEKSTFKIFGLERKDARFKIGDYINLGQRIFQDSINFHDACAEMDELAANCDIKRAVNELLYTDIYHEWGDGLKYLMYKRELFLAHEQKCKISTKTWKQIWETPDTDSIEHILPQSSRKCVFDWKTEKRSKIYAHRLGNLLVMDLNKNKSLQDKDPLEKEKSYHDLFIEKEVADLIKQYKGWTQETVKQREEVISAWIVSLWE